MYCARIQHVKRLQWSQTPIFRHGTPVRKFACDIDYRSRPTYPVFSHKSTTKLAPHAHFHKYLLPTACKPLQIALLYYNSRTNKFLKGYVLQHNLYPVCSSSKAPCRFYQSRTASNLRVTRFHRTTCSMKRLDHFAGWSVQLCSCSCERNFAAKSSINLIQQGPWVRRELQPKPKWFCWTWWLFHILVRVTWEEAGLGATGHNRASVELDWIIKPRALKLNALCIYDRICRGVWVQFRDVGDWETGKAWPT